MSTKPRQIVVDASFNDELGAAGVAVAHDIGGGLIVSDAVLARNIQEAEAWALLRGLVAMDDRRYGPGSVVTIDNLNVYRLLIEGGDLTGVPGLLDRCRQIADEAGYVVTRRPREAVRLADKGARRALRLWRAGAEVAPTWGLPAAHLDRLDFPVAGDLFGGGENESPKSRL